MLDQLATIAILATIAAIAVPVLNDSIDMQRLGIEVRNVERELQLARLIAVGSNRPIRVRFNCPSAGYYRRVELIGRVDNPETGDDGDTKGARRCSYAYYPYPAPDNNPVTRPNNDGPLVQLNSKVSFTSVQTLEFWPNGTVHVSPGTMATKSWPQVSTPVNIVLSKGATTRVISINGLGKTKIQ